jgi:hypothetical protein
LEVNNKTNKKRPASQQLFTPFFNVWRDQRTRTGKAIRPTFATLSLPVDKTIAKDKSFRRA